MKVVIQRVSKASVLINNIEERSINKGFVILLGITKGDSIEDINYLVKKIVDLRVFEDYNNKLNLSIKDINGDILLISQFTLYADTKKGNRPSFDKCMKYDEANDIYNLFINILSEKIKITTGSFGADMKVSLINDGPVTIIIDSKDR